MGGLCACDRAGMRPPASPPHPAPSLLQHIGVGAKTLAPKLKMIPELTDKFLLEQRGPLAGNVMLASDPSC